MTSANSVSLRNKDEALRHTLALQAYLGRYDASGKNLLRKEESEAIRYFLVGLGIDGVIDAAEMRNRCLTVLREEELPRIAKRAGGKRTTKFRGRSHRCRGILMATPPGAVGYSV